MGLFGSRDESWEAIKEEYRQVKHEIAMWSEHSYAQIGAENAAAARKFEYLVLENIDESALDERGANGWELVNFASYTTGYGLGGNTSMKVHLRYIFKRPIAQTSTSEPELNRINALRARKAELVREIEARGFKAE